ncbi:MAG TPA: helix-turn-helix transcriptional regulator [Thermoanaerobaculia bacterium]|nr:helix-turn-helix transcriptional regulator [Thermoanaerobaculia bacterium]
MSYVEIPPPAELHPWVAAFWCFGVRAGAGEIEHRIPLTGGLLLSVDRSGLPMLAGPRTAPLVTTVRGGDLFRGVHFHPGGARPFLHLPPGSLRDAMGPAHLWLDRAWCGSWGPVAGGEDDMAALDALARGLRELMPRAEPPDPVVRSAVDSLRRSLRTEQADQGTRVEELAAEVRLSPRQLRRRFQAAVGLSPKELARVLRLRSSAASAVLGVRPWADVSAEGGFADQAHLVREFRSLLGVTPGRFEQHARRIDHRLLPE